MTIKREILQSLPLGEIMTTIVSRQARYSTGVSLSVLLPEFYSFIAHLSSTKAFSFNRIATYWVAERLVIAGPKIGLNY